MLLKQSTVVLCSKIQFISIYIIYINFELRSVTTPSDHPRNNTDCTSCCMKHFANTSMFLNSLLQLSYNNDMLCLWKSKEIPASYRSFFKCIYCIRNAGDTKLHVATVLHSM